MITRNDYQGEDGTWQAGAIMAVMDAIGASAVYSAGDGLHSSVDLNSSFYSTAKIHVRFPILVFSRVVFVSKMFFFFNSNLTK